MGRWGMAAGLAAAIALGLSVPAGAAKVRSGAAEGVDLSRYRTFAWEETSPVLPPDAHRALLETGETALTEKGLRAVSAAEADVILSYKLLSTQRADVKAYGYADPDRWGIAEYGITDVRAYLHGQLAVFAEERESGALVWSAEAEAAVKEADDAGKQVRKLAERMFRGWPRLR